MILSCNSCEKKFVVPDNAIGEGGRLVQCSSCGNKWKQFPIKIKADPKVKSSSTSQISKNFKSKNTRKIKKSKKVLNRRIGPDLYSPEYLAKKHGIKLDSKPVVKNKAIKESKSISFGFYNSIIVLIIFLITFLKLIHFSQYLIIEYFPFLENYLNYLFETISNIRDLIINLF